VFCACEAIWLFSVVFCVVTDAHKSEVRLPISETPEECRPVGNVQAVTLKFLKVSTRFSLTVVRGGKGIYPCWAGQLHSLESGTVMPPSSRWVIKPWKTDMIWKKDNGLGRVNRQALVHVPSSVLPFSCTVYPSSPIIWYLCSLGVWLSDQKALIPTTRWSQWQPPVSQT
jgi:hypothetical protein